MTYLNPPTTTTYHDALTRHTIYSNTTDTQQSRTASTFGLCLGHVLMILMRTERRCGDCDFAASGRYPNMNVHGLAILSLGAETLPHASTAMFHLFGMQA